MTVVNNGNYFGSRNEAWSYKTCIRTTTADNIVVVNRTFYSRATTKHQTLDAAFWRGKLSVVVEGDANAEPPTGVPYNAGPDDLLAAASKLLEKMRGNSDSWEKTHG